MCKRCTSLATDTACYDENNHIDGFSYIHERNPRMNSTIPQKNQSFNTKCKYLSVSEYAKKRGLSVRTVHTHIKAHKIAAFVKYQPKPRFFIPACEVIRGVKDEY